MLQLFSLALIGIGYWGPWVQHPTAALTLLGIDLAEWVKFLPNGTEGWPREVFYLPAGCLSAALTLSAHAIQRRGGSGLRGLLSLLAIITAPTLLPPAWSPALLWTAEYRAQVIAILALLALALVGPMCARLPVGVLRSIVILLALAALPAAIAFWQIVPAIENVYRTAFTVGRGVWLMVIGWMLFAVTSWLALGLAYETESTMEE